MQRLLTAIARRWDWRLSARLRLVSLGSVWFLVFGSSLLAPVLPVLGILRMAFSGVQLVLNQKLARRLPIAPRDRYDWGLLLLAFAGSVAAASVARATGDSYASILLLPVLIPYSGLQLRSFRRSLDAHRTDGRPGVLVAPIPLRPASAVLVIPPERRAA